MVFQCRKAIRKTQSTYRSRALTPADEAQGKGGNGMRFLAAIVWSLSLGGMDRHHIKLLSA